MPQFIVFPNYLLPAVAPGLAIFLYWQTQQIGWARAAKEVGMKNPAEGTARTKRGILTPHIPSLKAG